MCTLNEFIKKKYEITTIGFAFTLKSNLFENISNLVYFVLHLNTVYSCYC